MRKRSPVVSERNLQMRTLSANAESEAFEGAWGILTPLVLTSPQMLFWFLPFFSHLTQFFAKQDNSSYLVCLLKCIVHNIVFGYLCICQNVYTDVSASKNFPRVIPRTIMGRSDSLPDQTPTPCATLDIGTSTH